MSICKTLSLDNYSGQLAIKQIGSERALALASKSKDGTVPSLQKLIGVTPNSKVDSSQMNTVFERVRHFNEQFDTSSHVLYKIEDGKYVITDVVESYTTLSESELRDIENDYSKESNKEFNDIVAQGEVVDYSFVEEPVDILIHSDIDDIDNVTNFKISPYFRVDENIRRGKGRKEPLLDPYENVDVVDKLSGSTERIRAIEDILGTDVVLIDDPNVKGRVSYVNGKPIVEINENLATSDTAFHEAIGHVFINSIGGLSEPRVKALADKLESENTQVWKDVVAEYPELSHEDQQLEAVAQSVGVAADQLFQNNAAKNSFKRFMTWLSKQVGKIFGIQPTEAYILAQEGLGANLSHVTGEDGVFYQKAGGLSKLIKDAKNSTNASTKEYVGYDPDTEEFQTKDKSTKRSVTSLTKSGEPFIKHEKDITVKAYMQNKASAAFKVAGQGIAGGLGLPLSEAIRDPQVLRAINESAVDIQESYDRKAQWGTDVHAIFEDIINGADPTGYDPKLKAVVEEAKRLKRLKDNPDYEVITEFRVFHEPSKVAGIIDLIVINKKTGTIEIVDFKTREADEQGGINDFSNSVLDGYTTQLSFYAEMLKDKYGINVSKLTLAPIGMPYDLEGETLLGDATIQPKIDLKSRASYDKIAASTGSILGTRIKITDDSSLSKADILFDKLQENLRVSLSDKSKHNTAAMKKKAGEQLELLIDNFKNDQYATVLDFVDYLKSNVRFIDNIISANDTNTFSIDELHSFKGRLNSLYVLDAIDDYVNANSEDLDDMVTEDGESVLDILRKDIDYLRAAKVKHEKTIIDSSKDVLAKMLAGLSNLSSVERKDKLILKFQKENPSFGGTHMLYGKKVTKAEWNKGLEEAVYNGIDNAMTDLEVEAYQYWRKYIEDGYFDISSIELYTSDAMQTSSILIQTVNKVFAKAEMASRVDIMERRSKFDTELRKNMDKYNLTIDEVHNLMIEKDENGLPTGFMIGKYDPKIYRKLQELNERILELRYEGIDETNKDPEAQARVEEYNKLVKERNDYKDGLVDKKGNISERGLSETYKKYPEIVEMYESLAKEADGKLNGNAPLGKSTWGLKPKFYKMPAIRHSTVEAALQKGVFAAGKEWGGKTFLHRSDDETQEGVEAIHKEIEETTDENISVNVGYDGTELKSVPIYYRGVVPAEEQSLDLSTMLMQNYEMSTNFGNKSDIQPTLELLIDVVKETRPLVTEGVGTKIKKVFQSDRGRSLRTDSESNEYKQLQSLIEHRLYGIAMIPSSGSKMIQAVTSYTANTMLTFNYLSGINNLNQGLVANFLESSGNRFMTKASMHQASKDYVGDMKNILNDINSPVPTSKTNLLVEYFNVQGEFTTLGTEYFKDNAALKWMGNGHGQFMSKMGEHFIQAQLIYAVLNGLKIMNNKGEYLDADGNIVSKEDAASLNDIISFENGVAVYNADFYTTNLNPNKEFSALDVSEYIRDTSAKLHGQYDGEMRSKMQRTAVGAAVFSLRRWMVRLANQKFKGASYIGTAWDELDPNLKSYSEASQEFQEGVYVTTARFIGGLGASLYKNHQLMMSANWNKLNQTQQGNVIKTFYEIAMTIATMAAAAFLYGAYEDDEDKEYLLFMAYMTRRLKSELSVFRNPMEMMRIARTPAVSMSMINNIYDLTMRVLPEFVTGKDISERYSRGYRKGELKVTKNIENVVPVFKQVNSLDGLPDKYKFLMNPF